MGRAATSDGIDGRLRWAALVTLLGSALILVGLADRGTAEPVDIQVVDLHNDRAEQGDDCPSGDPSWHFVIAPNNGSYAFVSISLMLSGTLHTYDSGDLIKNGRQRDNVFARVPAGYELDDLGAAGSYAEITPSSAYNLIRFVLSDWCQGSSSTTTTSVVPTTTTTTSVAPTTTTTTSVVPTTTTTTSVVPTTTSVVPTTTTTTSVVPTTTTTTSVAPTSTTTTSVAQFGPTTTSTVPSSSTSTTVASTTTTAAPAVTTTTLSRGTTPAVTGSGNSKMYLLIGSTLLMVGLSLLLGARRPAIDD